MPSVADVPASASLLSERPSPIRMLWITAAFGTCFLLVRWGLRDAPTLWFASLRAVLGGIALAIVAAFQRKAARHSLRTWALVAVLGVVNVSVAFGAMFTGIAGLATGTAAVLSNAQPLLILLPAWLMYGERVSARAGIALAVGFSGLLVVAVPGGGGSGALLSLLAAASVTAGTLIVRRLAHVDVVVLSAAHLVIGGVVLALTSLSVEGVPRISWTPRFVLVLGFLGLVATAATTVAWFVEAQRCRLSSLTRWMFLVPVFGLVIGVVVLGERPDSWTAAGIVLVLISMWVTLKEPGTTAAGPGHLHVVPNGDAASPSRQQRTI